MMHRILDILLDGLTYLRDYLFFPGVNGEFSVARLMSLLIAFSISGAIIVFMSQGAVLKHMGPKAHKGKAYAVASLSGIILAVCSCSVLPVFASIRKKGAGIGPAVAFLFSGPAINILAITIMLNSDVLETYMVVARIVGAIILAAVIGFMMFVVYQKSEKVEAENQNFVVPDDQVDLPVWQRITLFTTLFLILIFGVYEPLPTLILIGLLMIQLYVFVNIEDVKMWGTETYVLAKKIFPLFLIGVFFAGMLNALLTEDALASFVGVNTYLANLIASVSGAFMYFATLTEIPIIETFVTHGMHHGPATTLLLAGPTLSLPNMIVISRVIGLKKGLTYFALVIILSAMAGLLAGNIYGLL